MSADPRELMNGRQSAYNRPIPQLDVPCQCCIVRHNHVVADNAIVRYMSADHKKPVVADYRDVVVNRRTGMHRCMFSDHVIFADDQLSRLGHAFFVLRIMPDHRKRADFRIVADRRVAADPNMSNQFDAGSQLYLRADYTIRTDRCVLTDFGSVFNYRRRMDIRHCKSYFSSKIIAVKTASA